MWQSILYQPDWVISMKINGSDLDFTRQTQYSQARGVHTTSSDLGPSLLDISFGFILFTEMGMGVDEAYFPVLGLFQWLTGASHCCPQTQSHPLKGRKSHWDKKTQPETQTHPVALSSVMPVSLISLYMLHHCPGHQPSVDIAACTFPKALLHFSATHRNTNTFSPRWALHRKRINRSWGFSSVILVSH